MTMMIKTLKKRLFMVVNIKVVSWINGTFVCPENETISPPEVDSSIVLRLS